MMLVTIMLIITVSMEQSCFSEVGRHTADQEIRHLLWKPKIRNLFTRARP
jgi:hypothetical protein